MIAHCTRRSPLGSTTFGYLIFKPSNPRDDEVVDIVDLPTEGAATALLERVQQLQTTATATKQCTAALREASLGSAQFHESGSNHILFKYFYFLYTLFV